MTQHRQRFNEKTSPQPSDSDSGLIDAPKPNEDTAVPAEKYFLCLVRLARADLLTTGQTPEERDLLDKHIRYLTTLNEAGIILMAGRTTDNSGVGILIFRAPDATTALEIIDNDPAVHGGTLKATLQPFELKLVGGIPGENTVSTPTPVKPQGNPKL